MNIRKRLLIMTGLCWVVMHYGSPLQAQNPTFEWVRQNADSSAEMYAVTTDKAGNVYITGTFSGTVDFDPGGSAGSLTAADSTDGFIGKRNAQGELVWVKQISSTGNCYGSAIAVDDQGNVYICGAGTGTIDLDPGTAVSSIINATKAFFFAKYDASGDFVWGKKTGQVGAKYFVGDKGPITVSTSGNVYFSGVVREDSITFDPASGIPTIHPVWYTRILGGNPYLRSRPIMFIGKLDSTGHLAWVHGYSSNYGFNDISNLVLDREEHIYLGGTFGDTLDFDPGPDTTQLVAYGATGDVFVLKMSNEGELSWAKSFGGAGSDRGNSIAMDGCGHIYIAGDFQGSTADFDPGAGTFLMEPLPHYLYPSFVPQEIFMTKLDRNGDFVWAKAIRGNQGENTPYIAIDDYDNLYLTGRAGWGADYDPDTSVVYNIPEADSGLWGTFIAKYDVDGNLGWAGNVALARQSGPFPWDFKVSDSGNLYIYGAFRDTIDFNPGSGTDNLIALTGLSNFLLKLKDPEFELPSYDTAIIASCDSFRLGEQTFTSSGIYKVDLISTAGCDSVTIINLTINQIIAATISVNNFTLTTALPYETYQWCLDGVPISGATQSAYTVTENGNYTVLVTDSNGCSDTSNVYTVNNYTGINAVDGQAGQIRLYPNPAAEQVSLETVVGLYIQNIRIVNMLGAELGNIPGNNRQKQTLEIGYLPPAVYLLRIQTDKGTMVRKLEVLK